MNRKPFIALVIGFVMSAHAATDAVSQSASREMTVTRTARVETIDLETRQVLLRMENNDMLSLVAGPEVRNLPQLQSGDVVEFEYHEAVAVEMVGSDAQGAPTAAVAAERAPEGDKPGVSTGIGVRMIVEFVSYDPATHMASFTTPDGTTQTVQVSPELREFAAARKAGDRIDLMIVRAVAVSIKETNG